MRRGAVYLDGVSEGVTAAHLGDRGRDLFSGQRPEQEDDESRQSSDAETPMGQLAALQPNQVTRSQPGRLGRRNPGDGCVRSGVNA